MTGIDEPKDMFGITKIYPTQDGGREWFTNMNNPKDSPNFSITNNHNSSTNNWIKITELIDSGGWYSNTNNSIFFSAGYDKFKDHILASAGPLIIFRTDNLVLDFKHLSIREI
ncbi:MAG: hypothetical protein ACRD8W_23125 [Nitrososphaeraceae archaeon]